MSSETEKLSPAAQEALGEVNDSLDKIEEVGLPPHLMPNLRRIRDLMNSLDPDSRPYFSPKEEAARADFVESLVNFRDPNEKYKEGMTVTQAIEHLEKRTQEGLELVRAIM